ncbi:ubiquinone-binding protein [Terasakiella brassicae]|uniref:Ubiquinone-binding protein n=1 Tax=Terasakiella brassicae TaxID=1634917 RepID=A0A917C369_9PROT|nr:type II toxin-antitoxin system RatA family toxin [Terasakiella brassicae]GGF67841.1 ubiquinone-binding protein [Terasakiella brassicae]
MIREKRKLVAPYPSALLFQIAADVENYPTFLPHCIAARIKEKSPTGWRVENLYRWGPVSYKFITFAQLQPEQSIHIMADPKDRIKLDVLWKFTPIDEDQTDVFFEIGFESRIPILEKLVHAILGDIAQQTERAFLKRAEYLIKANPLA